MGIPVTFREASFKAGTQVVFNPKLRHLSCPAEVTKTTRPLGAGIPKTLALATPPRDSVDAPWLGLHEGFPLPMTGEYSISGRHPSYAQQHVFV